MGRDWPHKNLIVWKDSMELCKEVYLFTTGLPSDETFNLVSQLKRAAVSVPVKIAEGAARQSDKEFRQFLHSSLGSLSEVNTLLELCVNLGFCTTEAIEPLNDRENRSVPPLSTVSSSHSTAGSPLLDPS